MYLKRTIKLDYQQVSQEAMAQAAKKIMQRKPEAPENIVTGSYLGRVLEPEFRYSSGDTTSVSIYTLSYEEFLEAYDEALYVDYQNLPLFQADDANPELYDRLKEAYEVYAAIGGYPKVVESYLEKRDLVAAQGELVRIIQTFLNESMRYFNDIADISVFTNIFLSICRILFRQCKIVPDT